MKLSWPRPGDRRRAIVAKVPLRDDVAKVGPIYDARMIHITDRDMARHYVPQSATTVGKSHVLHSFDLRLGAERSTVEKVMDLQQELLVSNMHDATDEQELLHECES